MRERGGEGEGGRGEGVGEEEEGGEKGSKRGGRES